MDCYSTQQYSSFITRVRVRSQRLSHFQKSYYAFLPSYYLPFFFYPHIMYQRDARAGAFLGGDRVSGQDIRDQNGTFLMYWSSIWVLNFKTLVMAAQSIANIVKSSLGPLGLDKMLVDNIGVRSLHFALITCRQMLIV